MAARTVDISISISAEEFLKLYSGTAKDVVTTARDGRTIRFPANILRPYVLHDGIRGWFRIYFDKENKFQKIERLQL
ncbi:MAG: DUF2835 domain-containing protein [Cellvibrionaceae bacterium]